MKLCQKLYLLPVMLLVSGVSYADLTVDPIPDISLTAWAGLTGDLEGSADFCIVSTNPNNGRARRYDVAGYSVSPASTAGEFPLLNAATSDTMDIGFTFIHPNASYPLQDYNTTGYVTPRVDGATSCNDPLSQVQILLTLPDTELASATAGVYTGTLGFDVLQQGFGGQYSSVLEFQATIPELTQITRLDNLVMPAGTLQDTEDFCVFRNGAGGFSISVTGDNDTTTEFNLKGPGLTGTELISYTVDFIQGATTEPVEPGEIVYSTTTGFVGGTTRDCGNADNMTIQLNISQDMLTKPGGSYEDNLLITVAPG